MSVSFYAPRCECGAIPKDFAVGTERTRAAEASFAEIAGDPRARAGVEGKLRCHACGSPLRDLTNRPWVQVPRPTGPR